MSFERCSRLQARLHGSAVGTALLTLTVLMALTAPSVRAQDSSAHALADVPVVVGQGPDTDACGSVAQVSGLDPKGANLLSVRSGPGVRHRRVDRVPTGQMIWVCGRQDRWLAVVYSSTGGGCGVSTPVDPPQVYTGACRQGWVFEAYVTLVGG
jgi:uncharacterized protein YraI